MSHRPSHSARAGVHARDLRRRLTPAEKRLWTVLRGGATGARFRRRVPITIVDFASLDPRLVIEVDDTSHDWRDEQARTATIEERGFTILRFTNKEVAFYLDDITAFIKDTVKTLRQEGPTL